MSSSDEAVENVTRQLYNTVSNDMSFEDKANKVLEIGRQFLEADDAYISLVDQEIEHCEIAVSTYGPDGTFPTGMKPDFNKTYCRRTVEADEPIALHNAPEQGWEDDPAYDAHELEYYFGTKLFLSDDLDGTVCFVGDDGRKEPFTGEELLLIKLISQILTHELERKNHRAELERYNNLVNIINRVLRHNLRNDMSVIRGHTQIMAEQLTDDTDGKVALEKIDDLIRLGEKARELEEVVIEDKDRTQTDIGALVRTVVNDVKSDFPHASVSLDIAERATAAVSPSFEQALRELIENAAKHGGETPSVMISVAVDANAVEITIEDDGPGLSRQEQQVLTAGIETPLIHGSGLGLWLAHWVVTDHDGSIESTVSNDGTVMRVSVPRSTATSATRDEADLERARDQYQAAFEEAFDAVYILNDDARIIKANPAAADIYGLDPAELRGRSVMEFLPDEYSIEDVQSFIQQSNTEQETVTITSANGTKRIIEFSTTANIVSGQHLVIARDVTNRVEREQQLAEAQKAFENTQDAMFLIDVTDGEEFIIQRVNEVYESMTGLANEEIQGKTPREVVGEEIGRKIETQYQTCVKRCETIEYPEEIPVDGEMRHWRTRVTPIIDDGTVVKLVGAMRDVTEQKEQQQALQTERERFEQLLDTSPVGMAILDQDGSFVKANERAEEILGLSETEITDREYDTPEWELIAADGTPMPSDELPFHQVMQTGEPVYEYVHGIETADGTRRWLSINASPLTDDVGAIECVIAAITDITDQHSAQSVSD